MKKNLPFHFPSLLIPLKRKRTVKIVEQRWKCGMEIIRGLHNPFGSRVLILLCLFWILSLANIMKDGVF